VKLSRLHLRVYVGNAPATVLAKEFGFEIDGIHHFSPTATAGAWTPSSWPVYVNGWATDWDYETGE